MSLPSLAQDSIPGGAALPLAGAGIAPAESAGLILAHRKLVKGPGGRRFNRNPSSVSGTPSTVSTPRVTSEEGCARRCVYIFDRDGEFEQIPMPPSHRHT